jgi:hypothetical protein
VLVFQRALHTGFVVRTEDLAEHRPDVARRFDRPFIEVSWGDFEFFRRRDPGLFVTTSATLWPTRSTALLSGAHKLSVEPVRAKARLTLSAEGYERLLKHVARTLAVDERGRLIPAPPSDMPGRFFLAEGSYHLLDNCNQWTAQGLRKAGLPISPCWSVTAASVMSRIQKLSDKQPAPR